MITQFIPFEVDNVENYAFYHDVFTSDECDLIIDYGSSLKLEPGLVKPNDEVSVEIQEYRNSSICFMNLTDDNQWIFDRLISAALSLNSQFFKFNLTGLAEGIQFTKYDAPNGKYDYHIDKIYGKSIRKLSVVVQLTEDTNYVGGDLELSLANKPMILPRKRGSLCVFPSYSRHCVSKLTKGTRHSLVSWMTGPNFT